MHHTLSKARIWDEMTFEEQLQIMLDGASLIPTQLQNIYRDG